MKRLISLLFITCILLSTVSCAPPVKTEEPTVVTSCFPLYDFAKEIVKGEASVTMLLSPGEEAHSYEPTAQDILKIRDADLFLCIGGESEAWVDTLLDSPDLRHVTVLRLIDCVPLLTPGEPEHEEEDDHHHNYDEHIWTSPKNAVVMVEAIRDKLMEIYPTSAEILKANADAYVAALNTLDKSFRSLVAGSTRTTLIFGDRFPFTYFVHEYRLTYTAAYPGCAEASEPSAAVVAELIRRVRDESVPVVLCTELSSGQIADTICEATGAKKRVLHSCANVTADEWAAGEGYLSLMTQNLEVLREALGTAQ